jgi:hypothetical protein
MRVTPEARLPNIRERCEIDLSPGTRTVPVNPGEKRLSAGRACKLVVMRVSEPDT